MYTKFENSRLGSTDVVPERYFNSSHLLAPGPAKFCFQMQYLGVKGPENNKKNATLYR